MADSVLFFLGVAVAVFVGVNIGGSSTGVAFGPATGSGVVSMRVASALMALFVLLGGFTVGTNVVETLGSGFVPSTYFTPVASIGVLLFIGLGWGRASRRVPLGAIVHPDGIATRDDSWAADGLELFNPATTKRIVTTWIATPTVAGAIARTDATYEDIKGRLQALAAEFDVALETPATDHPSFIDGRVAEVVVDGGSAGVVGEVHPKVLVERELEVPVAAFEFRLDALRD